MSDSFRAAAYARKGAANGMADHASGFTSKGWFFWELRGSVGSSDQGCAKMLREGKREGGGYKAFKRIRHEIIKESG